IELVRRALAGAIYQFIGGRVALVEKKSESKIEILLISSVLAGFGIFAAEEEGRTAFNLSLNEIREDRLSGVQQYQWQQYSIDFALFWKGKPIVFVECDGHEFQDRTKEQAARDREIQTAGILAIRFTGREILSDPGKCVVAILNACASQIRSSWRLSAT